MPEQDHAKLDRDVSLLSSDWKRQAQQCSTLGFIGFIGLIAVIGFKVLGFRVLGFRV